MFHKNLDETVHICCYIHPLQKKHLDLIAKENLIDPFLFSRLNPYEFLFLDKEKKGVTKNFDERF